MVTLPAAADDGDVRPTTPALAMSGVTKSYGPSLVLNGVDFDVDPGEIHALMGENGAGKSTLMKIAAGLVDDYAGELRVGGAPVRFASPREAARAGIAIIHQELSLVPALAVDENIFLGQEKLRTLCVVDRKQQLQAARATLDLLDFQARVEEPVGRLRVGEQQLVEIAKALVAQARVLIMDEPTSALSVHESERLFSVIRRLARDGVAIVYISHRMEEVFALSARLTVLRDGRRIGTVPTRQTARGEVIRMMVGRELAESGAPVTAAPPAAAAPAPPPRLEVRGLWLDHPAPTPSRPRLLDQVSFAVRPGEVFGVAGLLGAGRTELLETLFGLHPLSSGGEVRLDGRPVRLTSPAQAKAAGLAFVTEDRKRDGLILDFSITQVVGLPMQERLARFGFVRRVQEVALARRTIAELGVAARGPAQPVGTLSGGNQQKVVIGKWLQTGPRVLLLDEPTRGIDVGAKAEIYRLVGELTGRGLAIVLVSSELPELVRLSHRILVLREGRPTALFERGAFDQETLLEHASPGGPVQPAFAAAAADATPGAAVDAATAPASPLP